VAIFGAGIAGLTAAHELAESALDVTVYEPTQPVTALGPWTAIGGKARSQYFRPPAGTGETFLPGEHGFRFFPSFYANTFHTLDRIPIPPVERGRGRGTVFDRLKPARTWGSAYADGRLLRLSRQRPEAPGDVLDLVRFLLGPRFSPTDAAALVARLVSAMARIARGRDAELDDVSFWDVVDARRLSPQAQRFLRTMPRALVGMDPENGSARTLLLTLWRLLVDQGRRAPGDFVLSGPTSEAWLEPWFEHLSSLGVRFALGPANRVVSLRVDEGELAGVELADGAVVTADHYVLAVPLRAARSLLGAAAPGCDHALSRIDVDRAEGWMVGAQAFVRGVVPGFDGHVVFTDSPWCVSAVTQHEYWCSSASHFRREYGAGVATGVISVIFSAEDRPGLLGFPALGSPKAEVCRELGRVLSGSHTGARLPWLTDESVVAWHLDDDIALSGEREILVRQQSPLLIHPPGMYATRPGAVSGLRGLSLAGEYLRTSVDLATMEGANESGRMAARHALESLGRPGEGVFLYEHRTPSVALTRFLTGATDHLVPGVSRRPAGVLTRANSSVPTEAAPC
jgi:uncharacterized protein with NAD-binding domain and iron-sulfur cluster